MLGGPIIPARGGLLMGYAFGPMAVDWEERYDFPSLRRKRVERVREQMEAAGVDAILVWKNENVRYLTSLPAQLLAGKESSLNGALLTREAGPILFCSGGELDKATRGMPWLAGIHPIPIMEQPELCAAFATATLRPTLADLGLCGVPPGIAPASVSPILVRVIAAAPIAPGDHGAALRAPRASE